MESQKTDRGRWASSVGFILASAGAAIGLGNVWKFPYLAARYGGGSFLLAYLIIIVVLGMSVLVSEIVLGRNGGLNPVGTYRKLSGTKAWGYVGFVAIAVNFIVLSYYSVVGGWILNYMVQYLLGGIKSDSVQYFVSFISNPYMPLVWYLIFMGLTIYIVARGVAGGIEKANKFMMPALFILFIILVIRSVTLPGAASGLAYYLVPDFSKLTGTTFLMAMGQVFFSLNIGAGCTMTYASYLSKDENIPRMSFSIAIMDTLAAFLAGLIVIPSVFAFGLDPSAGPPLLFITMPQVFGSMPVGALFGFLFFLFMLFAALTSSISMLEVNVSFLVDNYKYDRMKAALTAGILIYIFGIPSSLSQGIFSWFKVGGLDFLNTMDFIASYVLMPFGAFMMCVFIGWFWGVDKALKEATNDGKISFGLGNIWGILVKYVVPVIIILVFLSSTGILRVG